MDNVYKSIQELKATYNNCTIIEGLKAVEFMDKNELPVKFDLNGTYDFIVISAKDNNNTKVQHGVKGYCGMEQHFILEESYDTIDTDYKNLINSMKIKKEMKLRKVESIVNSNLTMDNNIVYSHNKCEIKEGFFRKEDILQLIKLGCKVEGYVIMDNNQEYKTIYKKNYILEETSIYCPTNMRIPSGEFEKKDYSGICEVVYADTWIIRL